jgi:hypothetical protein
MNDKRTIVDTEKISIFVSKDVKLTPAQEIELMNVAVKVTMLSSTFKGINTPKVYRREADGYTYFLDENGVVYSTPHDSHGRFNRGQGAPISERDIQDSEWQDLVMELSQYFGDIRI